ncbi:MAG: SDR family NAD(P)-dependent oxidoreductase, partial [Terriglobia bacterium]
RRRMDTPMKLDFSGKSVLVTGGTSGIGKEISVALAKGGARVGLNFRSNEDGAASAVADLASLGARTKAYRADLARPADVKRIVADFGADLGPIDILVNNAGIGPPAHLEKTTTELWNQTLDTNLTGIFNVTKECLAMLKSCGSGKIINISSIAGITGGNLGPAYAASKAGIIGLTRSLARELAPHQVNVNTIAPGPILTPLVESMPLELREKLTAPAPIGRMGRPEDIADLATFLASSHGDFITGQVIVVDGGRTMMGF